MAISKKAQISIEILILVSVLIVAGVIFASFYLNQINSKTKMQSQLNERADDLVDNYKNAEYLRFDYIINSPNQSNYTVGTNINFKITPISNNGNVTCTFSSSISGDFTPPAPSCNFNKILTPGNHLITITARDSQQTVIKKIQLIIN